MSQNTNGNTNKIGKFFRDARLKSGLELSAVADELGLASGALLGEYEEGAKAIPLADVFALTNLYNVSPDEVVALFYELSVHEEQAKKASSGRF